VKKTQRGGARNGVTVYAGSTDPKAHLLEFGHLSRDGSFVRPFPVMRPAWDETKEKVLELFKAELWNALVKTARRLRRRAEKLAGKMKS
jgi:hypothetical protein